MFPRVFCILPLFFIEDTRRCCAWRRVLLLAPAEQDLKKSPWTRVGALIRVEAYLGLYRHRMPPPRGSGECNGTTTGEHPKKNPGRTVGVKKGGEREGCRPCQAADTPGRYRTNACIPFYRPGLPTLEALAKRSGVSIRCRIFASCSSSALLTAPIPIGDIPALVLNRLPRPRGPPGRRNHVLRTYKPS
jgi:hypothetical protein